MPRLLAILLVFAAAASAQSASDLFNRPPAGLDELLRQRVTQYFHLQMEGKFRQAEALVCEVSRDAYYDMEKTRWKSFELLKTTYEDEFRTGRAVVVLGTTLTTLQGPIPAKYPLTTIWKLENGQWCYYIDPERAKSLDTPFGKMSAGPDAVGGGGFAVPDPERVKESFRRGVTVSQSKAVLRGYEKSSATLQVTNTLPGSVELDLNHDPRDGFTAKLGKTSLSAGESTSLELSYQPSDRAPKPPLALRLTVSPGSVVLPVEVEFALPPEVVEKIPEGMKIKPIQ